MQSNPIHGWIQSMDISGLCPGNFLALLLRDSNTAEHSIRLMTKVDKTEPSTQESLADAKVSARKQCMSEGP